MPKKCWLALLALLTPVTLATALELNRADQQQLESVKGIGPVTAARIVEERRKGDFRDWSDFIARVRGVGSGKAAQFSQEGLTLNGTSWSRPEPPRTTVLPALTAETPLRR